MKTQVKSEQQIGADRREEEALCKEIGDLLCRVPDHSAWSYQKAVDFKRSAVIAQREVAKSRRNLGSPRTAAHNLRFYHQRGADL